MEKTLPDKKSKLLTWTAIAIIVILITSIVLYFLFMEVSVISRLSDPEDDVVLSMGTEYPGMIDVVNAALEANVTTLNVTMNMKNPIPDLGDGEYAQWNLTIILENETELLKAYELCVQMNSTQLSGYIVEIGEQTAKACQACHCKNSLTVLAVIDELQSAKEVEWSILTTYERYSGDELITSGSDIAPDEGLQRTVLKG